MNAAQSRFKPVNGPARDPRGHAMPRVEVQP